MCVYVNKITQDAIKAISEIIKNLKHLIVIVEGKTGAEKSALINAMFREKLVSYDYMLRKLDYLKH